MTILITGGAGFIGSHVAEQLLKRGEHVAVLDNFNDYYDPSIKRQNIERIKHPHLTVVEGDVRDAALVHQIFQKHKIHKAIHLAAMAGVRASVHQVELYMSVNTIGSMNIFEAAAQNGTQQIVLASTSSVYGKTDHIPFVETDNADRPLAAYPASKRAAEILAYTYHNLYQMNITVLRFFNVYGPAGRPDMMPIRLMEAAYDGTTLQFFNGGDIQRDWTYIDDTVNGVIRAADKPLGYEVINLGYGSPISLLKMVELIEEFSGRTIHWEAVPTPPSDPPITYCDNTKAQQLLGFSPQIHVEEGLFRTWKWFCQHKGI
ncbi:MAG: epimerase [Phototrophicales bacterium]|nr:MAG: epimerase [Phototrophicales bacterium]